MQLSRKNPQVDAYLRNAKKWRKELEQLRTILLGCRLTEELKWSKPCYTFQEGNIVILLPLKDYCALLFCKGALIDDDRGMLVKAGENTQAARQIRFTHVREIVELATIVKAYIQKAIAVEKAGLEVVYKKTEDFVIPVELQRKLRELPALKRAFHALTPGRQRGYLLFFSAPKQAKTREARIEKCLPRIFQGRGLTDR
jgi:uncharacterized protein YdeI (YjbR/CyaY-like superfamily)